MHLVTMAILIICLVTVFPSLWEKTCYFYLSFLSVASQGLWDPSSPTGDWAWALWQWKWRVLPTGPPVKSQAVSFLSDLSKKKKESEVTQSCLTLCDPWTVACRLFHPWNFPGKSAGVGCHHFLRVVMLSPGKITSNQLFPQRLSKCVHTHRIVKSLIYLCFEHVNITMLIYLKYPE